MIVAGFGFRASATVDSLASAFERASGEWTVDALAVPADKCEVESFQSFSDRVNAPIIPVAAADLEAVHTTTQSAASITARGTGSVSEAAALAAAGLDATLLAPRSVSEDRLATCSLAKGKPT